MDMKLTFPGGAKVQAAYKGFDILTDQPTHGGGDNSAPAPFDLFLASIGTCAGIFVLRFLEQRKIPTEGVYLNLTTTVDRERHMLDKISISVHLPEEFPEKYRNAIMKAVDLCAVKRHVHEPPAFETLVHIGDRVAASSLS